MWGSEDVSHSRTIDVHIQRLRAKLASGSARAPHLTSVRGFGYRLEQESAMGAGAAAEAG